MQSSKPKMPTEGGNIPILVVRHDVCFCSQLPATLYPHILDMCRDPHMSCTCMCHVFEGCKWGCISFIIVCSIRINNLEYKHEHGASRGLTFDLGHCLIKCECIIDVLCTFYNWLLGTLIWFAWLLRILVQIRLPSLSRYAYGKWLWAALEKKSSDET